MIDLKMKKYSWPLDGAKYHRKSYDWFRMKEKKNTYGHYNWFKMKNTTFDHWMAIDIKENSYEFQGFKKENTTFGYLLGGAKYIRDVWLI